MKRYYNEAETPLKFHKVYLVILALRIMGSIYSAATLFIPGEIYTQGYLIYIVYDILCGIVCGFAFWGLFTERAFGWYSNMLYLFLGTAYNLFLFAWGYLFNAEMFWTQLPARMVCLPFLALTAIYYIKRKPLFFQPNPVPPPKPTVTSITHSGEHSSPLQGAATEEAAEPTEPPVVTPLAGVTADAPTPRPRFNFCPNCGKRLQADYRFCPDCGMQRSME